MSRITEIHISRSGEETDSAVLVYSSNVGDETRADADAHRRCAADPAIETIAYHAVTAEGGLDRFHVHRNDAGPAGADKANAAARGMSLFKGVGMMRVLMLVFTLALIGLAGAAVAAPKGYGVYTAQTAGLVFSAIEKRLIRDAQNWRSGSYESRKARKSKRRKLKFGRDRVRARGRSGALPPGLEKQLKRNGKLPPGLRGRDLPPGLKSRLPPPSRGTKRVILGNDVVLVEKATNVVLDILRDVVKGR